MGLQGKKKRSGKKREEAEKMNYGNILNMYGFHDATCYKYRKIEKGINKMTVKYILEEKNLFLKKYL
ncbi:hypothetical protein NXW89_15020 [Bacteroides thetaiotaomicron]|nr:hypothetical protein [Bacteroides thetaiotaomicron]